MNGGGIILPPGLQIMGKPLSRNPEAHHRVQDGRAVFQKAAVLRRVPRTRRPVRGIPRIESHARIEAMPIDRKAEKIKQDKELAKLIEKANKESEELVEYIAPTGSMKSNKNIEVNINGVQYTVPRGVKTNIPRKVAEIIDNSIKQAEFAQGVQDKAAEIAQQAIAEGRI